MNEEIQQFEAGGVVTAEPVQITPHICTIGSTLPPELIEKLEAIAAKAKGDKVFHVTINADGVIPVVPGAPTETELRVAIKHPGTPEAIRKHAKKLVYGEPSQKSKPQIVIPSNRPYRGESLRPPGMSGRRWRKARKLLRAGKKAVLASGLLQDSGT